MISTIIFHILEGFFIKAVASFDDTLTRIPVITHLTRTFKGRIAFSLGTLLALTVVLTIAGFFSAFLSELPYTRYIAGSLILILAVVVNFDFFGKPAKGVKKIQNTQIYSPRRFGKIMITGFVVSFVTLIDDSIVLVPIFLNEPLSRFFLIVGVYAATLVQITIVIYFSSYLSRVSYQKQLASLSLLMLSLLVYAGIV